MEGEAQTTRPFYSDVYRKYLDPQTIKTLPLNKMKPGTHRKVRESGLKAIETMMRLTGSGNQGYLEKGHEFIVLGPDAEGFYEILDGNHRWTLWTKRKEITEWSCYVIPRQVQR